MVKPKAENKRALELDANDPRVYASLGRQYLNPPSRLGGDVAKAMESFRKSTELDPKSDEAFVWLPSHCARRATRRAPTRRWPGRCG